MNQRIRTSPLPLLLFIIFALGIAAFLALVWPADLTEPPTNRFTTDEKIYLKTYYLLKAGQPYYQAIRNATEAEAGNITLGSDVFTWRWPALFYFWSIVAPTGNSIVFWFWLLNAALVYCLFQGLKTKTTTLVSIISIALVIPYLAQNYFYPTAFLFHEWWALAVLTMGLTLWHSKHLKLALVVLSISLLIRELIIIPLLAVSLFEAFRTKKLLLPIYFSTLFLAFYGFHAHNIHAILGASQSFAADPLSRFHLPTKETLQPMLAFSTQLYPFLSLKSTYTFLALGLVGIARYLFSHSLIGSIARSLLAWWAILPLMITSRHTDYWGILIVPITLAYAPSGIRFVCNKTHKLIRPKAVQ